RSAHSAIHQHNISHRTVISYQNVTLSFGEFLYAFYLWEKPHSINDNSTPNACHHIKRGIVTFFYGKNKKKRKQYDGRKGNHYIKPRTIDTVNNFLKQVHNV